MTNLEKILFKPENLDDVVQLQKTVPILSRFSPLEVAELYTSYSRTFAAQWLGLNGETVNSFRHWLLEEAA